MEGGSFIIIKIGEREEGEFMNKKLDQIKQEFKQAEGEEGK